MDLFIGDNLRKLRRWHDKKQTEVAKCIGLSVRQYRKMENNQIQTKIKYINQLSNLYKIDIDSIIKLPNFNELRSISRNIKKDDDERLSRDQ